MCKSVQIIEFKNAIRNYVSDSPLPDEVKRMVLEQCLEEQTQKTLETVRAEIKEREEKEDAKSVSEN